ncbi:WD40-repeat-containing domain protein [Chaetomidium leptoderma]|uniref:WD40-repeat-containing domain protein n=1 Tax=Chaetomidium leptoderma TaxID=669021 RepID=A0AAN7A0B0_9PEZI|nr:WD40-repeat-containing domain protein [Chaetomidium leptoderma]
MNTRTPLESPSATVVLSISFNDDCSCFAVGLNTGFCIFHAETCALRTIRDFNAGVGLVQMMGKANYVGLVGGGRQPKFAANKLIVWDDLKSKAALEISALTPVRGVQLSKDHIVVVLQNSVRVYKFAKPPNLLSAYETANNPWGLCCLSPKRIAFPGRTTGHVQLVEIATGNVSIIPAHTSAVKAIQLSPDGDLLATASETVGLFFLNPPPPLSFSGTLIRVFATSNCARLVELRRGIDPATIFSLAFNPPGTMLACTSDKSTLHIFDVPHPKRPSRQQQQQQQQQQAQNGSSGPTGNNNNNGGGGTSDGTDGRGKWGILSKIPMMPRMFSDVYSFASAPFEVDDEEGGVVISGLPVSESTTLGTSKPPKGVIGWVGDETLLVVGAGKDARWEKFVVREGSDGRRHCVREGWKRYLAGP